MPSITQSLSESIWTSQAVSDLELAARELHILRRALHAGAGDELCQRLRGYAALIEAALRPESRDELFESTSPSRDND
ncbi:MAG: hypothetical protein ACJ796_14515 [Gemmatimonadaceae bacterium]